MKKAARVHKDRNPSRNSITPASLTLKKKALDVVSWEIDVTVSSTEFLSVTSSNPSIVPTTNGTPGDPTLTVSPTYPASDTSLTYTISLNNGTPTPVAGGSLVIDTIGDMEPHPEGGKGGHKHRH